MKWCWCGSHNKFAVDELIRRAFGKRLIVLLGEAFFKRGQHKNNKGMGAKRVLTRTDTARRMASSFVIAGSLELSNKYRRHAGGIIMHAAHVHRVVHDE